MLCAPLPTANDCWTCGAAFQFVSPAWLALTTHVPTAMKLTVEPETEQIPGAPLVKLTARPDVEVAPTV